MRTQAPGAVAWIRLYVGAIFLSEGVQKFLFPDVLAEGRFAKAGIPFPGILAPLVGVFEIGCGLLILAGLLTRLAAVPMIVDMVVALGTTKLPILWGQGTLYVGESGWWDFAHEARTDLAMVCGSVFLFIAGAGRHSLDAALIALRHDPRARRRLSGYPALTGPARPAGAPA
ncbi:DoxX family protein [Nonomuraea sp. B12E4]|uniref:DoxX family protein n=1 Tax=Nonomuraea sp. B12E4 TaxID=3153564 RepID=UPI00325EB2BA